MKQKQTLVLDINELYRVIPDTKSLEGRNFRDIRDLLKELIAAIEKTGQWEFIQYINNKPSLFIIREISAPIVERKYVSSIPTERPSKEAQDEVESHYNQTESTLKTKEMIKTESTVKEEMKETEKVLEDSMISKLPWEK